MKRCKKCGELKPLSDFYKATGAADGHRSDCKTCNLARKKVWYAQNRDTVIEKVKQWQRDNPEQLSATRRAYRATHKAEFREGHLRRTFGITQADYEAILRMQGGGCAICGKVPGKISLHVDHDHTTGEVRGLLCVRCNNALGQFRDDLDLLSRASEYLVGTERALAEQLELTAAARLRAGELREVAV